MRILLVDDEEELREIETMILSLAGHQCQDAKDVAAAQVILEQDAGFDLLITDLHMPGKSGIDLYQWCRRRGLTIPVLFLTGNPDMAYLEKSLLSQPGVSLLDKPAGQQQLLAAIQKAVNRA